MFSRLVVALVSASVAVAVPYRRSNALTVSLSSSDVNSIADLTVDATVTNSGTEDVRILKYGTVLDNTLPTRSFTLAKDDSDVSFIGTKLSIRSLDKVSEDAFITIPAGQNVTVSHKIENLFDFESAGTGAYSINANTKFQLADSDNADKTVAQFSKADVTSASVTVNIAGDIARRNVAPTLEKRAKVSCSDSTKKSFISASFKEAKELAKIAASYISSNDDGDLFEDYYSSASASSVKKVFTAVANEDDSSRTLNCNDPQSACDGNVIAYTLTSTTDIYFCDVFFDEVETTELCSGTTVEARNIRGGTTLHELTHALSGTDDVTYGCSADQQLSQSEQVSNADNYNCFSTQVYADTEC